MDWFTPKRRWEREVSFSSVLRPAPLASVIVLLALSLLLPAGAHAQDVMRWTVDGASREAIVVSPAKQYPGEKAPLVFAFHGHGDTMQGAARGMRLETYWPEAIVVYPQGLPTNPATDPQGWGWTYSASHDGQRDVKFVDAMLATLRAKFTVDEQSIYATGFSNGGVFTYDLWSARPNLFAAFAVVAGRLPATVRLTEPKALLVVGGKLDRNIRFTDQLAAIKAAQEINGAKDPGTPCGEECTMYASSKGAPVITYIHGGGHVYPQGMPYLTTQFFKKYKMTR